VRRRAVICRECWASAPDVTRLPPRCAEGAPKHRPITVDPTTLVFDPRTRSYEIDSAKDDER
jgi:hypothetical protein